jgi:uncharacterized coiled-coil protein SlyX
MVGLGEIGGLMSSLKAAKDLAQAMIDLNSTVAFQAKAIEFQSKILDAQNSAFAAQEERSALVQRISELEKEVARLEAWETEKQRYELKGVGYGNGALVYQLKPDAAGAEQPHSICANCYQSGAKSILQSDRNGGDTFLVCPKCKTSLITGGHGTSRRK